jgi:hypothetical protein
VLLNVTVFAIIQTMQLFADRKSGLVGSSAATIIAVQGGLVLLPMSFTAAFICGLGWSTIREKQKGTNPMLTAGYYSGPGLGL